jgi:flagellar M-ring protein FliF
MEAIKALLKQITTFWAGKEKRFKRNVIVVAVSVLAAVIVLSVILNQVPYSLLYSGLNAEDASSVMKALDAQNEPFKVSGDAILVPTKDVDKLRMSLSAQVSNTFNIDILKQGQGLGTTESQMNDLRKAQLEYNIQQAIMTVEGVKSARVLLTIPEDSPLVITTNRQNSTASLLLTLNSGVELTSSQVKAIAGFVQKGVPGLTLDNISIMDSNLRSLDIDGSGEFSSTNDRYALRDEVASKLRKQIMNLLLPIFGIGHVEAQVNVVLNFDDKTTDTKTFTPVVGDREGIAVSSKKLREQIQNGADAGSEPGVDANTGTDTYPASAVGSNGTYEKTEESVNYEVDSIYQHVQEEKGKIEKLSVSVVIDNTNLKIDLTDNVKNLVKNAVGAASEYISVEYMPMQGAQDLTQALENENSRIASGEKGKQTQTYIIVGAIALPVMLGMLLLYMSGRSRRKAEIAAQPVELAEQEQIEAQEDLRQMAEELADIQIVQDSGTKEQIGKLIEKNPELVANLLRSWLADEQE